MSICYIVIGEKPLDVHFNPLKQAHSSSPMGAFVIECMSMRQDAPDRQKAFYHSRAWQKCRREYIASVGGVCERCQKKGIIRPGYIVHHKEYITIQNITDPEVLLSFDNLEYLCFDCHQHEHFPRQKRYRIDEFGRCCTPPYS